MAKYTKAHPFEYVPRKKEKQDHYGQQKKHVQIVRMTNGQVRTIQHYY